MNIGNVIVNVIVIYNLIDTSTKNKYKMEFLNLLNCPAIFSSEYPKFLPNP